MKINPKRITGHTILIMAPSGSGKGTLLAHVQSVYPEVVFAVSCTSRPPRPGEVDGRDYYFISRDEFTKRIVAGEFIEWAEFGGNLYGTLAQELIHPLYNGQLVINEIEVQGVEQLSKHIPPAHRTIVYIDAGDWETLKRRILSRAPMDETELEKRKQRYVVESQARTLADIVINNIDGKLEDAKRALVTVVEDCLHKIS